MLNEKLDVRGDKVCENKNTKKIGICIYNPFINTS